MIPTKGFLSRAPDGRLRMTKEQLAGVVAAFNAAVANPVPDYNLRFRDFQALLASLHLDYPIDRSCYTCDFEREGHCLHWKDAIPAEAMEDGCDHHQGQGAPF